MGKGKRAGLPERGCCEPGSNGSAASVSLPRLVGRGVCVAASCSPRLAVGTLRLRSQTLLLLRHWRKPVRDLVVRSFRP